MKTFILPWTPSNHLATEDWYFRAMRNLEWGDIQLTFTHEPGAESGDNFFIVRTGWKNGSDGVIAKGFFITTPSKTKRELFFTAFIRPTFMVSWNHPQTTPQPDAVRRAVPEIPDLSEGSGIGISKEGAMKLNAVWDCYTAQFAENDFGDNLAARSGRPAAVIDEAVALASEISFDCEDRYGQPAVLGILEVGLAGDTNDEKICGFLHEALKLVEWQPGELRAKGFTEDVVDVLCELKHSDDLIESGYADLYAESGNRTAISVMMNSMRYDLKHVEEYEDEEWFRLEREALESLSKALEGWRNE